MKNTPGLFFTHFSSKHFWVMKENLLPQNTPLPGELLPAHCRCSFLKLFKRVTRPPQDFTSDFKPLRITNRAKSKPKAGKWRFQ
jgi:hypothetical protein